MIVVDTNVIADIYIPGPRTSSAKEALLKDPEWCAPPLWKSELRNALALYLRKERLVFDDALKLLAEAESLVEDREFPPDSARILRLVADSNCSAYDCEFVALAQELSTYLVTSDKRLIRAFPETAVPLETFSSK